MEMFRSTVRRRELANTYQSGFGAVVVNVVVDDVVGGRVVVGGFVG